MEITTVTKQEIGYTFSITIEKETRVETGAKYPDKQVVCAKLGGNAETFKEAQEMLVEAKKKIREVLKEEA